MMVFVSCVIHFLDGFIKMTVKTYFPTSTMKKITTIVTTAFMAADKGGASPILTLYKIWLPTFPVGAAMSQSV